MTGILSPFSCLKNAVEDKDTDVGDGSNLKDFLLFIV
jgi:hypothetical protein